MIAPWLRALLALVFLNTGILAQSGWTIGPDAAQLTNPLADTQAVLNRGMAVFASRCRRCHGPEGRGNGPASDPQHPAADLTAARIDEADGVLFYKVWNGRKPMPAFRSEMTRDEVWTVVAYVKTLRQPK